MDRTQDAPLRLEGLAVQTRLARPETPRYLVLDLRNASLAVYRAPPPNPETPRHRRAVPSKLAARLPWGRSADLTAENLAHVTREPRDFPRGTWEPKFTVPADVAWKIR